MMLMTKKAFIIRIVLVLSTILVLLGGFVYYRFFFTFTDCDKETVKQNYSPSNVYIAKELRVDCALSDYATQVSLRNLMTGNEEVVVSFRGDLTKSCDMNWIGDSALNIECIGYTDTIYSYKEVFEGLKVKFELKAGY
jgi:hypothetical protein